MIEASRKYNVTLMEAMKPTLTPNFRAVRENLHRLGTIRRYFSCYCQYSSRYDKFKGRDCAECFQAGTLERGNDGYRYLYALSDGSLVRAAGEGGGDRCRAFFGGRTDKGL